jgi:hypothetical protein
VAGGEADHDEGRIRATEVRAGQFLGSGAVSLFTLVVQPNVLAGRPALLPADLDSPPAYSAIDDVVRTLVRPHRRRGSHVVKQPPQAAVTREVHVGDGVRAGDHARDQREDLCCGVRAALRGDVEPLGQ